jgi:hypothetical protein
LAVIAGSFQELVELAGKGWLSLTGRMKREQTGCGKRKEEGAEGNRHRQETKHRFLRMKGLFGRFKPAPAFP